MNERRLIITRLATMSVLLLGWTPVSEATGNFVTISLPHNLEIDIPRNWEILSKNNRITIDSAVESRIDLSRNASEPSALNFAANYIEDGGKTAAIINVRFYPAMDVTQNDADSATVEDVNALDAELREGMTKAGEINGFTILQWRGTSKEQINGTTAFVTEYKRSAIRGNGDFVIRLVRVFNGSGSFTLTVSYRDRDGFLLRPICDRIIASLSI